MFLSWLGNIPMESGLGKHIQAFKRFFVRSTSCFFSLLFKNLNTFRGGIVRARIGQR